MSDTRSALEAAIREDPADLAAWYALADLLIERADPRGEFMRVQLALEDEGGPKKQRAALRAREQELLAAHRAEWLGPLAALDDVGSYNPQPAFTRGWLTGLRFPWLTAPQARALVKAADAARFLTRLEVHDTNNHPTPRGKDIPQGAKDPALEVLMGFPGLAHLRAFHIGEEAGDNFETDQASYLDGPTVHRLIDRMPRLEELYLVIPEVLPKSVFALPRPGLRVLLVHESIEPYPVSRLAANKSLGHLTHLLLQPAKTYPGGDPPVRPADVRALAAAKTLPALTHLRLRRLDCGDEAVRAIVAAGLLDRLTVLDLAQGSVTDAGATVLADCPAAKNLHLLNLNENALTLKGITRLARAGVRFAADHQHAEDDTSFLFESYEDNWE